MIRKVEQLINELKLRDMHLDGVAAFLECSETSSRKYMNALFDASIVSMPGNQPCRANQRVYRLHGDQDAIDRFLGAGLPTVAGPTARTQNARFGIKQFHVPCDASGESYAPRAVRDPLVAALFGSACGEGQ